MGVVSWPYKFVADIDEPEELCENSGRGKTDEIGGRILARDEDVGMVRRDVEW
jgi:hypothetical protein